MASQAIHNVVVLHQPLKLEDGKLSCQDRALLQELVLGTLRYYLRINGIIESLLTASSPKNQGPLMSVLACGIYQILYTRIPSYAAVNETVNAAKELKLNSYLGLINAILHKVSDKDFNVQQLLQKETEIYSYPKWLIQKIKKNYPKDWQRILQAGNEPPALWIRIDLNRISMDDYIQLLDKADLKVAQTLSSGAIRLQQHYPVNLIPGLKDGLCYIQDLSAQNAVVYLDPQPGESILDACAAPGGKTTHILEYTYGQAVVTALDIKANRLKILKENLALRNIQIKVIEGSADDPKQWWDGNQFDKILLDAPCSGSGVIRRHPDIKFLRSPENIQQLVATQEQLLESLWPLVKKGGILMYTTCSIFKEENLTQINNFLYRHRSETSLLELPEQQHLPGDNNQDGFFYAKILKKG